MLEYHPAVEAMSNVCSGRRHAEVDAKVTCIEGGRGYQQTVLVGSRVARFSAGARSGPQCIRQMLCGAFDPRSPGSPCQNGIQRHIRRERSHTESSLRMPTGCDARGRNRDLDFIGETHGSRVPCVAR